MKLKKEKLNIVVPMAKIDEEFINEFQNFKYLSKLGNKNTILSYSKKIFREFQRKFNIKVYFLITEKIQNKYNIKKHIDKLDIKYQLITLKKETKNIIDTILHADSYLVNKHEKIIVFHPDVSFKMNFDKFWKETKKDYDGIIFGYNHFNPTDYSSSNTGRFLITKDRKVKKIFEKSALKKNFITCAGMHYFKNWKVLKFFAEKLLNNKNLKYKLTSEIYNLMINKDLNVKYFEVKNFISFSNISSVSEHNFWNDYFLKNFKKYKNELKINNVVPAAGSGKRHKEFNVFKPFIKISNKLMIHHALETLPVSKNNFVLLRRHVTNAYSNEIKTLKKNFYKDIKIIQINNKTDGMARSCLFLEKYINKDLPLMISSCDYKFIFNEKKFHNFISKENPDSVIFTFRGYPDARIDPNSYAYVKTSKNKISKIVEKKTISKNPHKDFAVTGAFYFKNWHIFKKAVDKMIMKKNKVNGEYYVATAIQELLNKNYKILNFEIDKFISWSLPVHLKTYLFWEEIFSK